MVVWASGVALVALRSGAFWVNVKRPHDLLTD